MVELLAGLAIVGILSLAAARPAAQWWREQRSHAVSSLLESHLALARSAAIAKGQPVALTPFNEQWSHGWRVHLDANADGRWGDGEDILASHAMRPGIVIQASGVMQRYVLFEPSGRPVQTHGAFLAGTFSICASASGPSTRLVMSASGRVRKERALDSVCEPMGTP
ncbi:GspH/FimT family pseudopilin [Caldimonas sp.]|uniref:GspH/FimT family pseudopilin n=1 Tax=Caldimonas sp. TaxID=2838790 RepID=UPI00391B3524